jgi:hypothetical protein
VPNKKQKSIKIMPRSYLVGRNVEIKLAGWLIIQSLRSPPHPDVICC